MGVFHISFRQRRLRMFLGQLLFQAKVTSLTLLHSYLLFSQLHLSFRCLWRNSSSAVNHAVNYRMALNLNLDTPHDEESTLRIPAKSHFLHAFGKNAPHFLNKELPEAESPLKPKKETLAVQLAWYTKHLFIYTSKCAWAFEAVLPSLEEWKRNESAGKAHDSHLLIIPS